MKNIWLKLIFFIFLFDCFLATKLYSSVEWADTVISVSGKYIFDIYNRKRESNVLYAPQQILGKPNIMPDFGESPCAWAPRKLSPDEFVVLGFKKAMHIKQVSIYESFNPGAITKITLIGSEKDTVIYQNSLPALLSRTGRVLTVHVPLTFYADKLRIDMNTVFHKGALYQIDAVAISDEKIDIKPTINLSKDVLEVGELENLGVNVNSDYVELAPIISPDGKVLYFTREEHPENTGPQSIWFSELDSNGRFKPAKNIGAPLNTPYHNFVISILPDGNSMLVGNIYNKDGTVSEGFSMTYRQGNTWSFPKELKVDDYYNKARGSYALASNGRILIISAERDDSYGTNDLFVCFLKDDGTWTRPKNIGATINTAAKEDTPFLAADGITLYFSSSGHTGYGSNDIFVTKRLDDTWQKWTEPINLGTKINTTGWDAYFTVPASGEYAYLVSSLKGHEDIYRAKLPEELKPEKVVLISGRVLNKKNNEPLEAIINYETLSTGEIVGSAISNSVTGEYKIVLPAGTRYGFRAEANDFISINESLDLINLYKYDEIYRDLYLVPIEKGQTLTINNIFFETASYKLKEDSYPELIRLAEVMLKNSFMKIKISGHTDNIGSEKYNLLLSKNRANAVKEVFIKYGVGEKRIEIEGFAFKQPIATNKTEDGRAKNRRVEMQILEIGLADETEKNTY